MSELRCPRCKETSLTWDEITEMYECNNCHELHSSYECDPNNLPDDEDDMPDVCRACSDTNYPNCKDWCGRV